MYRALVLILAIAILLSPGKASAQIDPAIPAGTLVRAETVADPSYFRDSEGQIQFWMMVTEIRFSKTDAGGTMTVPVGTPGTDTDERSQGRSLEIEAVFGGIGEDGLPEPLLIRHTGFGSRPVATETDEAQHVNVAGNDMEGSGFRFVYEVPSDAVVMLLSWLAPSEVTLMIDLRDEDPEYSRDMPQFEANDREGIAYKFTDQPQATMQLIQFSYAEGPNDPLRNAPLWQQTYVILEVEITNISDTPIELRAEEFYLWTSGGVTFKPAFPASRAQPFESGSDVTVKTVLPGESVRMTLFIPYTDTVQPVTFMWFMNDSWTVIPLAR